MPTAARARSAALLLLQAGCITVPTTPLSPSDMIAAPIPTLLAASLALTVLLPIIHVRAPQSRPIYRVRLPVYRQVGVLGLPRETALERVGLGGVCQRAVLGLALGTAGFHIVAVLFGAPFFACAFPSPAPLPRCLRQSSVS